MKKVVFILLFLVSVTANAQQYRKFLFAMDFGSPLTSAASSTPIGLFSLEPGYRIHDNVLIGFRIESTGMFSNIGTDNISLSSMGINGQYYFSQKPIRPFAGLGIGLYNPNNNFIISNTDNLSQRNGIGFYPRVGFELGHMRLMLEYNIVQTMKYYISPDMPPIMGINYTGHYENINQSYLSLKIGFFIGGGKKKMK